ncbi:hypothetical protein T484DRAFT_1760218, partial [Baffinella frigidus]
EKKEKKKRALAWLRDYSVLHNTLASEHLPATTATFALPASFSNFQPPLRHLMRVLMEDDDLRLAFRDSAHSVHDRMNSLHTLRATGKGDALAEAACLAVWGLQDHSLDLDSRLAIQLENRAPYFSSLLERVADREGEEQEAHWATLIQAFPDGASALVVDGADARLARDVTRLRLLVLAHCLMRPVVVLADDYTEDADSEAARGGPVVPLEPFAALPSVDEDIERPVSKGGLEGLASEGLAGGGLDQEEAGSAGVEAQTLGPLVIQGITGVCSPAHDISHCC